jgi:hypothetical protein
MRQKLNLERPSRPCLLTENAENLEVVPDGLAIGICHRRPVLVKNQKRRRHFVELRVDLRFCEIDDHHLVLAPDRLAQILVNILVEEIQNQLRIDLLRALDCFQSKLDITLLGIRIAQLLKETDKLVVKRAKCTHRLLQERGDCALDSFERGHSAPGSPSPFENIRNGEVIKEISENAQGKYHHDNLKEPRELAKDAHVFHRASIQGYRTYTEAKVGSSSAIFHSTSLLHSTWPLRHPLLAITLISLHLLIKHFLLLGAALRGHLRPAPTRGGIL